jgi:hypothetical protein
MDEPIAVPSQPAKHGLGLRPATKGSQASCSSLRTLCRYLLKLTKMIYVAVREVIKQYPLINKIIYVYLINKIILFLVTVLFVIS